MSDTAADLTGLTVGVLGGTGPQGKGLALRWAMAGLTVLIGSRSADRAEETARAIRETCDCAQVTGASNHNCAATADIVLVSVPWDGHAELLRSLRSELAGKIVIDCVNPLGFDKQGPFPLFVAEGSAAQQAAELVPDARTTAAFHHVSAVLLNDPEIQQLNTDVLVLGDDREAAETVIALASAIPGIRGIYGGRLRNAGQVESLTANLIAINRRYRAHSGLRITDV